LLAIFSTDFLAASLPALSNSLTNFDNSPTSENNDVLSIESLNLETIFDVTSRPANIS